MKNKLFITVLSAIVLSSFATLFPLLAQAEAGSQKGDVNLDGAFNISDVVLLQKWLLAVPDITLADPSAADFCEDGRLDVFDLCLMKKMIIDTKIQIKLLTK